MGPCLVFFVKFYGQLVGSKVSRYGAGYQSRPGARLFYLALSTCTGIHTEIVENYLRHTYSNARMLFYTILLVL